MQLIQGAAGPPSQRSGTAAPSSVPPSNAQTRVLNPTPARWLQLTFTLRRFIAKYFVQLHVEYESLCPDDYKALHADEVETLRLANAEHPDWHLNHRLEYLLLAGIPDPVLRQRSIVHRERLMVLAGPDGAAVFGEAYARPAPDMPVDQLRVAALGTLMEIQRLRHVQSEFERLRNRLISISILPGFVFVGLAIHGAHLFVGMPLAAVSAIFGILGGYLSVLFRISSLRWAVRYAANYQQVDRLFWNVFLSFYLSLLEGALGAIVLYVIFSTGILRESVFPVFPVLDGNPLLRTTNLTHACEAQLMLWSVVAGFSERAVPDFLSSLGHEITRKPDAK